MYRDHISASEMTYIVSSGALNSTHSLTIETIFVSLYCVIRLSSLNVLARDLKTYLFAGHWTFYRIALYKSTFTLLTY